MLPDNDGSPGLAGGVDDHALIQTIRERRSKQHVYRTAARGLTQHCHISRIATKGCGISLHPFQRGDLIHVAVVAERAIRVLRRERRVRKESKPSYTIVKAHEHYALPRKMLARVYGWRGTAIHGTAAVNPDENRQLSTALVRRNPNVRIQAIL